MVHPYFRVSQYANQSQRLLVPGLQRTQTSKQVNRMRQLFVFSSHGYSLDSITDSVYVAVVASSGGGVMSLARTILHATADPSAAHLPVAYRQLHKPDTLPDGLTLQAFRKMVTFNEELTRPGQAQADRIIIGLLDNDVSDVVDGTKAIDSKKKSNLGAYVSVKGME